MDRLVRWIPEAGVVLRELVDRIAAHEIVLLGNARAAHQAVQRGIRLKAGQLTQTNLHADDVMSEKALIQVKIEVHCCRYRYP